MADPKPEAEKETQKEEIEEEEEDDYSSSDDSDFTDSSDEGEEEEEEGEEEEAGTEDAVKKAVKKKAEEEEDEEEDTKVDDDEVKEEELWNFPPDDEHWTEQDLGEHWEDYWGDTRAVGWDPNFVSDASWEKYRKLWSEGKPAPPRTPYYVPYRKFYPPIPDNHFDIQTPEDVVEELERTEETLRWYSYLFKNGSSYEGTVWDDLAHGKGVYTTAFDICRYEGEWFQNMMQGHGVLEVDLPVYEPVPDSEEAIKAKAEGQILRSDYMSPFDREWLKMDIEEQFEEHGRVMTPWEERRAWIDEFGELPEKGHYKYAGQWKHNRFHGCGVYEINGRSLWGKFYFGELLPDPEECNVELSAIHSSLGEVAAAKARMFANKPDGMVRQVKGPFSDPSHPYMYEEEDLWMAPGFINAYYEVPDDWKLYTEDLDNEREMWLNSFLKAPFVIPMPPELEYVWQQEDEFVLLGNAPSAMLELNPENLQRASKDLQGEVLLHVPTGRIINWATDSQGRLRFFFQPITENGKVIPEAIIPLPQGFDEYMEGVKKETEVAGGKKKNLFQKVREAWSKSSEHHSKERGRKREELQSKWKQEDQALEFRRNLRRAERILAYQIEREKLRAERKSKSAPKGKSVDQTQLDGSIPEEHDDGETVKGGQDVDDGESKEAEAGTEDKENTLQEDQGDQEDNDDDKKPRSFGKVALVGIEDKPSGSKDTMHMSKEHGSMFPTTFASLTFGPRMAIGEAFKSEVARVVADLWHQSEQLRFCYMGCKKQSVPSSQRQNTVVHTKKSQIFEDLRLRVSGASQKPDWKMVYHINCGKRRQVCFLKKSGAIGSAHLSNKQVNRLQHQRNVDTIWTKPVFEFLSMALPVEQ